jgi:hypothetical protein
VPKIKGVAMTASEKHREYMKSRWENNPIYRQSEYERRKQRTPEQRAALEMGRHKLPNRMASRKLRDAIKCKKIFRPESCEKCGSVDRIQGHHDDYSKPLEVKWVCHSCHMQIHGKTPRT